MGSIRTALSLIKTIGFRAFTTKAFKKVFKPHQYSRMKDFYRIECYFKGKYGLEIGGPSAIFDKFGFLPIYNRVNRLDNVNFASSTIWTGRICEKNGYVVDGKHLGKQYILDAVDLSPIKRGNYDFVLSSNNIEHIANPLKAVEQWLSVLKPGGILVIVAPRKEANFDHNRKIVQFNHLIDDYKTEVGEDDLSHLDEILALHDLKMDPPAGTPAHFKQRSQSNFKNRSLHHHVFDINILSRMLRYFKISIIYTTQLHTDYVIIGQKH